MLRLEGEPHYTYMGNMNHKLSLFDRHGRRIFLLLLHAQYGGVALYKRNKYSSSTFSEWKGRFIRKSLPTQILASPYTEEEKIFFFFYILRVEGEFH